MSCCKKNNQLLLSQLWRIRSCDCRITSLVGRPISSLLEAEFGVPVVDNDANVAALGSIALALDKDDSFMYITVSTGVGGSERTPLAWCRGYGREMVVDPANHLCLCGKRGCRATGLERVPTTGESVYSTRLREGGTVYSLATTWKPSLVKE